MSFKEKILNNSDSYAHYKNTSEQLILENKKLKERNEKLNDEINKLKEEIESLNKKQNTTLNLILERVNNIKEDSYIRFNDFKRITGNNDHHYRKINNEIKYALVFKDTIIDSDWLKNKNFSLVNSAANYSFMYSLYRILNDAKPKNILEMGLGQTTKLTSQYANYFKDSKLTVLEGDELWIENFSKQLSLTGNIEIANLDLEMFDYDNTNNLRFKNISDVVLDKKFDLVIIDGPQGFVNEPGSVRELDYSRSNIWQLIPNNLKDDFIIIMDDYNRFGEQNTIVHTKELLYENNISFGEYSSMGLKTQHVLFTDKFKFIGWI